MIERLEERGTFYLKINLIIELVRSGLITKIPQALLILLDEHSTYSLIASLIEGEETA